MSPATATPDLGWRALRHLSVRPGQTLLDVSAGSEALTIAAARAGADVTAIDISHTMVELVNERAHSEGLAIAALVMDPTDLAFDDDCFDFVTSLRETVTVPEAGRRLAEMIRVVRPGGQVQMVALEANDEPAFRAFLEGRGLSEVRVIAEPYGRDGVRSEVRIGIGTKG